MLRVLIARDLGSRYQSGVGLGGCLVLSRQRLVGGFLQAKDRTRPKEGGVEWQECLWGTGLPVERWSYISSGNSEYCAEI